MTSAHQAHSLAIELLTKDDVARIIKRSARHVQNLVSENLIPAPIRIGGGRPLWRRADIEAWINAGCRMPEPITEVSA